jgi:hypothetical protein
MDTMSEMPLYLRTTASALTLYRIGQCCHANTSVACDLGLEGVLPAVHHNVQRFEKGILLGAGLPPAVGTGRSFCGTLGQGGPSVNLGATMA